MSEFRGYRPCKTHRRGRYLAHHGGMAMLICLICHQPYYMDKDGKEVPIDEVIKRLTVKKKS